VSIITKTQIKLSIMLCIEVCTVILQELLLNSRTRFDNSCSVIRSKMKRMRKR